MKFEFDPPGPLSAPQGSEGDPVWIFVTPETYPTTFVSKIFWLDEILFWPPRHRPEWSRAPRGQGSNLNSLFRALRHEDLNLSIWLGYYKWFPRSFPGLDGYKQTESIY